MGKIVNILFNTLLVIIIIALALYFALRITGRITIYSVETGSMENKIHPGDYILLFKQEKYHVGDIVTFNCLLLPTYKFNLVVLNVTFLTSMLLTGV